MKIDTAAALARNGIMMASVTPQSPRWPKIPLLTAEPSITPIIGITMGRSTSGPATGKPMIEAIVVAIIGPSIHGSGIPSQLAR